MFVEGLFSLLSNDPNIRALVGTNRPDNTTGIFPTEAPDESNIPYIVYMQAGRTPILSFQGVNQLQEIRVEISCYGSPYKTVKQLAQAVKNALDGFTGELADGSVVGNTIPSGEHDEAEPMYHGTLYGIIMSYTFVTTDVNGFSSQVQLFQDPLNGVDVDPLPSPWIADPAGIFPPCQILNNQAVGTRTFSNGCQDVYVGTLPVDQYAQFVLADFVRNGNNELDIQLRSNTSGSICYSFNIFPGLTPGSDAVEIAVYLNNSLDAIKTYTGPKNLTFKTGDIFLATAVGSTLSFYQNGQLLLSVDDGTISGTGYAGFYLFSATTVFDIGVTNFSAGSI